MLQLRCFKQEKPLNHRLLEQPRMLREEADCYSREVRPIPVQLTIIVTQTKVADEVCIARTNAMR